MLEDLTPPRNKALYCKVEVVLAELSDKDKQILIDALANTMKWGHNPLSRALKQKGIELSDTTIAKHRSGECRCEK
jgi:hypothetical protein